jgi:hypothetical protein
MLMISYERPSPSSPILSFATSLVLILPPVATSFLLVMEVTKCQIGWVSFIPNPTRIGISHVYKVHFVSIEH